MKKFYLGALCCLLAMGASAQTFKPVGTVNGGYMMGAIGKEFTNIGKGIVYTMEEGDNNVEFKMYDEQFNVTQTLNMNYNNYNRIVTEQREAVASKNIIDYKNYDDELEDWLVEKFAEQLTGTNQEEVDHFADSITSSIPLLSQFIQEETGHTVDSTYIVDSVYTSSSVQYIYFITSYYNTSATSKLYPQKEFCMKKVRYDDSYWDFDFVFAKYNYNFTYTGEWITEVKYYGPEYPEFLLRYYDFDDCIMSESVSGYIFGTQSLFNNDNKLEFVRSIYEEIPDDSPYERDRDYDGEVDYREINYDNRTKAFEIINEDNEVLTTIDSPINSKYSYPYIFKWGDNFYLAIHSSFRGEDYDDLGEYEYTYSWDIYLIEKATNSIRKVNTAPLMSVIPALAERNSTVNVTLDVETVKNGGELIITDSNGRTVGRSHVEAGQTSVPVTTDRMGSGVYNITLTEKGQKVENARIIVK